MTPRSSIAAPILAALAIVLLPLGTYVGGYLWLGEAQEWYSSGPVGSPILGDLAAITRAYPSQTLATIYKPAGKVEAWLRGVDIEISGSSAP